MKGVSIRINALQPKGKVPESPLEDNANRLFIHTLSSHQHGGVCDVLEGIDRTILPGTPGDCFVFSLDNLAEAHVQRNCRDAITRGTLTFLSLGVGWSVPEEVSNSSKWHMRDRYDVNYRRMGNWKLTYPMSYAKSLGYRWVLQIDTDSDVKQPLQRSVIEELDRKSAYMAGRATAVDLTTWGLPELTRYFLVAEQITPQTLFQYCKPQSIDGLYTLSPETFPGETAGEPTTSLHESGGWNKTVIYTNFVVISTDFWFRDDVQKYLRLVLTTGGHVRFRWVEQAVMSMIWQIFVPPERFHLFTFDYEHKGIPIREGVTFVDWMGR